MTGFTDLLLRNRDFASTRDVSQLTAMPSNRVFLVTCLDPRVEPSAFLGVGLGDAIVLRNPGGRVTPATVTDIALISYMGEFMGVEGPPMEVAVIHHTGCGMGLLADEGFRTGFASRTGQDEAELAALAVTDPEATVRADVRRLSTSPLATPRITVSGHVLDLSTGLVTTVVHAAAPGPAGLASA